MSQFEISRFAPAAPCPYIRPMPKGPQGQKRPADVIGAAVLIGRIATGEAEESPRLDEGKARAGAVGGQNRAKKLSSEQRAEIAKAGAAARKTPK